MNKYQVVEITDEKFHAGTKATEDITKIAGGLNFNSLFLRVDTNEKTFIKKLFLQFSYFFQWFFIYFKVSRGSVLLLQHPFHHKQIGRNLIISCMKHFKNVKIISVVHDVEELRKWIYSDYYKIEFQQMLENSNVFIVHNKVMKNFFVSKGIDEDKIITLEIFDYLLNDGPVTHQKTFEKAITIAGNLDPNKSSYLKELDKISGVNFELFGVNFDDSLLLNQNIKYNGAFPVDTIPYKLNKGFGLVWDGDSIETCSGFTGEYLKFNNPHKLSLYIASGLPVIIWKKAAESAFVIENKIGFAVDNLLDIEEIFNNLSNTEYDQFLKNIEVVSKKITNGYFSVASIETAERIIRDN